MSSSALPLTAKPLSQIERVIDVFIAPGKTFADIRRSAAWWLPYLMVCVFALTFSWVILHKIGLPTLVESTIHSSARMEEQVASATPEQAAHIRAVISKQFSFMYVAPVFSIVIGLICAGILLAVVNFGFGGRATYGQLLAVWFYGTMPLMFISILTIVTVYAGMTSDSFDIKNPVGTNVGYYLLGSGVPRWLETMLSSVDVFTIWSAVLLTLGISIVAGLKKSSAAIAVVGLWVLWILLQTGFAAVAG